MDEAVERALAEARALGFLGDGPLDAHERSARSFAHALGDLPAGVRVLDLGSGGGVPGLLLASWFADVRWVLLDKHRRRTSFLARTVATLGWRDRVEVERGEAAILAHDPAHRGRYAAVVSRSFGTPAITAEIAVAFLEPGGRLLVAEPPAPADERWPVEPLAGLGLSAPVVNGPVVVLQRRSEPSPTTPRAWRQVSRSPLW